MYAYKNIDSNWKRTKITMEEAGGSFLEISQAKVKTISFTVI